jgi:protein-disulfide isomerase
VQCLSLLHESRARGRARVRTVLAVLAVAALLAGLGSPPALAQAAPEFTITPVMIRGPAAAPVTIVEFSDYQ